MPPKLHGSLPTAAAPLLPAGWLMRSFAAAVALLFVASTPAAVAAPAPARWDASLPSVRELPFAVSDYWSGEATCLSSIGELDPNIERELNALADASYSAQHWVRGIRITASPELASALAKLLRGVPPATLSGARDCASAACVAQRVFGKSDGPRYLYLLARYGYNASPFASRDVVKPTSQELEDMLLALSDMERAAPVARAGRSRTLGIDASPRFLALASVRASGLVTALSSDNRRIVIRAQPLWREMTRSARRATMFHEFAHDWLRAMSSTDVRDQWATAMAADDLFQEKNGRLRGSVSLYAAANLDEDFAESATAFRYALELLAHRTPNRARLLRTWMGSGNECHPVTPP